MQDKRKWCWGGCCAADMVHAVCLWRHALMHVLQADAADTTLCLTVTSGVRYTHVPQVIGTCAVPLVFFAGG
jgi:hypothetical protein